MYNEPLRNVRDWFIGLPVYFWTVTRRWSTLIGGGIMSSFVFVWDKRHDSAHLFSLTNFAIVAAAAWIVSGYDAWHAERAASANLRESLRKGRPDFVVRILQSGFAAKNSDGHSDAVAWIRVTNHGTPATIRNWSMWREEAGNRIYGVDRRALISAGQSDSSKELIDEKYSLMSERALRTVLAKGECIEGALQFAIPGSPGSFQINEVRVCCESAYDGQGKSTFASGPPQASYSGTGWSAPSHFVALVNSGKLYAPDSPCQNCALIQGS